MKHSIILLLTSGVLISELSLAKPINDLQLSYGKPITSENMSIHVFDARLFHAMSFSEDWPCQFGPAVRAGYLSVGDDGTYRLGVEGVGRCNITDRLTVGIPLGMTWLSQYEFRQGRHDKDFGGPWQFLAAINVSYRLTDRFSLGYELAHMSNWNQYKHNPTLNSHNLLMRMAF